MVVVILTMFFTNASDESTAIKYQEGYTWKSETYKDDEGKGIAPEAPEGYLFAGWYTKEGTTYKPVSNPVEDANYFAKFVPEKVLGMKAQISKTLTDDNAENDGTTAAIRFVTSIDNSKEYKHVGFNIKKGSSGTAEDAKTTDYIYRTIYAVGATDSNGKAEEYVPEELFHEASYYFKTWTIGNIKEAAYNTEITVIPYWITLDGTRVEGTKAIKVATINLGRSWIYVNETANEDGKQYGTKKHPYNDFATALDNIVLDKNGKILLQSDYTEEKDFVWESHGKDIDITGVQGAETLDFSNLNAGSINDGVAFSHMTLKLRSGNVYACGNDFTIASDVDSDNPNTVIYGGAYGTSVEKTNVTILAGNYKAIYGGGAVGGTVTGDTHVTIENSNVFNTSESHVSRVHGGGNKASVEGNTYVTIGDRFNTGLGNSYADSEMHSTVYGGGYGESGNVATVKGDTKVVVKSGARVNYVFGAGGPQSAVEGTSRILFEGGYAMGLYGGANGSGTNSHTLVKMTGGQVEQIFGGNQSTLDNSMVGSSGEKVYADVQVLGGTVTRRIYGGCYNDYDSDWSTTNSVEGYSSVTIGSNATISNRSDSTLLGNDTSVCSISRLADNAAGEMGVMVLNPGVSSSDIGMNIKALGSSISSAMYTNFLVMVEEGGAVTSKSGILHISTDTENGYNYATVTYGDKTLGYVKGEGKCSLPELNDKTTVQKIQVTFYKNEPSVSTEDFAVKSVLGENFAYYTSLEEALQKADKGTEIVILRDITVSTAQEINKDLTITSESAVTITRDANLEGNMFTVKAGTFWIKGTSDTAMLTIEGNKAANETGIARAIRIEDSATCKTDYVKICNFTVQASAGAVSCSGILNSTNTIFESNTAAAGTGGAIYASSDSIVDVTQCQFISNTASNGGGAIHILATGAVTSNNTTYSGNQTTVQSNGNGGAIYCQGTYNDTNSSYLNNTSARHGGAIIVQSGAQATLIGTDSNAKFSNNKANQSANGNALYVNSGATVSISNYTFKETAQKVQVSGTLTISNITGSTLVKAASGVISVAGYSVDNKLTVTPNKYEADYVVLSKAEKVEDTVFKAACAGITVTRDSEGQAWHIDEAGKLQLLFEAYIGDTIYEKFTDAIAAANVVESTEDVVVYVHKDVEISSQVTISHNMQIVNESGKNITITRSTSMTSGRMFYLGESAATRLTFGTNDASEQGTLVVQDNGEYKSAPNTRIVDNRANGTFILGKNATLQNANSNQRGSALVNRGTAELYGSVKNNICIGDGGAILQVSGTLTIYDGIYKGNEATKATSSDTAGGLGSVITAIGGTVDIQGGTFTSNTTASRGSVLHAIEGTTVKISGGNFGGNTAFEGGAIYCYGILQIAGPITEANKLTVTPSEYAEGKEILTKSDEDVDDSVFQMACASIQVTADADGGEWIIDSAGKLQKPYAARIGETLYATFVEAIDDAKTNGGTGSADDIVVYVRQDLQISELKITKNIKIQNELGIDVTIEPSVVGKQMFIVNTGAKLTLGTNENTEGQLIINGATSTIAASRIVQNPSGATFVLGKNATLQNANYNGWGTALNNAGKVELYGNVINNISKAAGGAILQSNANAELIIYEGNYSGNQATRTSTVSQGSAIIANGGTVTIKGGTFSNNSTTGAGGAIYVYTKTTVTISGGTFTGNTAGTDGNAIYIASGGTVNVTGGTFATEEPAQEIFVAGTLNYINVPEVLIKGTGTKTNTSQTK